MYPPTLQFFKVHANSTDSTDLQYQKHFHNENPPHHKNKSVTTATLL